MNEETNEVMLDLLVKKVTEGLSGAEEKQLADLQAAAGIGDQSASFEMTAAQLAMTNLDTGDEMPSHLRSRIMAEAARFFDEKEVADNSSIMLPRDTPVRGSLFNWLGWAVAAVACVALALNVYFTRNQPGPLVNNPSTPTPEQKLTPEQMRQRLIESAPDLARGTWGAGNVKNVMPTGDIVWSDAEQSGYMRLAGLPVNDPAKEVYQLWIFDETQSEKTPIDGGTFSVNANGEIIIPINASLPAKNTKMYAITIEKSPGVVVSDRQRIVALAKRET